jgi:AcrR family transcriptional regulator
VSFDADFEHRDALIHAAIEEFARRGFDGASLNRILDAAGMSKGQLYHHFTSKEDLFLSLVDWSIAEKGRWLVQNLRPDPDLDFFDLIRSNVIASLEFTRAHPEIDRLSRAVLAERGRAIFDAVTARAGFSADGPLDALIAQHHGSGAFRDELRLEFLQRLIPVILNNLPNLLDLTEPADLETRIDELTSWLRRSLGPP